jgi:hypothetical protein
MKTWAKAMIIAVFATLFCLSITPNAMSAERGVVGELTMLPYSVSIERSISKEFSSPRYSVSREGKIGQETAVLTSFALIDYTQSVSMFFGGGRYRELNPILGKKPSRGSMALFGIIGVTLFYLVADSLSDPWKQVFVDSIIASEQMNIEENRRVYLGWNTDGPPVRGRSFSGVPIVISFRL